MGIWVRVSRASTAAAGGVHDPAWLARQPFVGRFQQRRGRLPGPSPTRLSVRRWRQPQPPLPSLWRWRRGRRRLPFFAQWRRSWRSRLPPAHRAPPLPLLAPRLGLPQRLPPPPQLPLPPPSPRRLPPFVGRCPRRCRRGRWRLSRRAMLEPVAREDNERGAQAWEGMQRSELVRQAQQEVQEQEEEMERR